VEETRTTYNVVFVKLKGRGTLGYIGIDRRIILKRVLEK
jgi:hypothetical protein